MLAFNRIICQRCQLSTIQQLHKIAANRSACRPFTTSNNALANSSVNYNIENPLGNKNFTRYLESIRNEYTQIENNYTDIDRATLKRKELLKQILATHDSRKSIVDNLITLNEVLASEKNSEMLSMGKEEIMDYEQSLQEHDEDLGNIILALNEDDDYSTVHLEVTAGVGGSEAQLFATQIFDMYMNYVDYKGWDIQSMDESRSDSVDSVQKTRQAKALITGPGSYRTLKLEAGVHRVQRVPATERSGRIHTSTITVAVVPQPDDFELVLNPRDLRIDTMRSSGPGGQNVNKVESAIRIVHIPSGIAVECQEKRSQIQNREIAMRKLHAKLSQIELEKQMSAKTSIRKSQVSGSDRNLKIRTYNFKNDRITDHRLENGTIYNLTEFFNGQEHLDQFIQRVKKYNDEQRILEILQNPCE